MRRIRSPRSARAASGHAAAQPSSVTNSRRLIPGIGFSCLPPRSVYRTLNLPQRGRQVLGADLKCSESRRGVPTPLSAHDAAPLHCGISTSSMSALGQTRPANADNGFPDVRFTPKADKQRITSAKSA
jgi:hypothetical protein